MEQPEEGDAQAEQLLATKTSVKSSRESLKKQSWV